MRKPLLFSIIVCLFSFGLLGQEASYTLVEDIPYYVDTIPGSDAYRKERCKLDIYYPEVADEVPVVVWFHGGGLTSGEKYIPEELKDSGLVVVAVNYRLHPKVNNPVYIEDAAAAVAWVFQNIKDYQGDPDAIFVSGHSAGGYLASMVGLDKEYLDTYDIDTEAIAGLIPLSGHTITHFTIRKENDIPGTQPIIDRYAPLFHVSRTEVPILLITGDRELELLGRYEENAYFRRMMLLVGSVNIQLLELDGHDHTGMVAPSFYLMKKFIDEVIKQSKK